MGSEALLRGGSVGVSWVLSLGDSAGRRGDARASPRCVAHIAEE